MCEREANVTAKQSLETPTWLTSSGDKKKDGFRAFKGYLKWLTQKKNDMEDLGVPKEVKGYFRLKPIVQLWGKASINHFSSLPCQTNRPAIVINAALPQRPCLDLFYFSSQALKPKSNETKHKSDQRRAWTEEKEITTETQIQYHLTFPFQKGNHEKFHELCFTQFTWASIDFLQGLG